MLYRQGKGASRSKHDDGRINGEGKGAEFLSSLPAPVISEDACYVLRTTSCVLHTYSSISRASLPALDGTTT